MRDEEELTSVSIVYGTSMTAIEAVKYFVDDACKLFREHLESKGESSKNIDETVKTWRQNVLEGNDDWMEMFKEFESGAFWNMDDFYCLQEVNNDGDYDLEDEDRDVCIVGKVVGCFNPPYWDVSSEITKKSEYEPFLYADECEKIKEEVRSDPKLNKWLSDNDKQLDEYLLNNSNWW